MKPSFYLCCVSSISLFSFLRSPLRLLELVHIICSSTWVPWVVSHLSVKALYFEKWRNRTEIKGFFLLLSRWPILWFPLVCYSRRWFDLFAINIWTWTSQELLKLEICPYCIGWVLTCAPPPPHPTPPVIIFFLHRIVFFPYLAYSSNSHFFWYPCWYCWTEIHNCLCAILCIFRFERPDFPQFFSGATPLVGRFVVPSLNILTIWFQTAK